jgi:hypothetical protein
LALRSRHAASAIVTAIAVAALAWALGVPASCGDPDASPEGAVRAFVAAARAEDKAAVWELLGPATRRAVTEAAAAATDKVGGAGRFGPLDLLDVAAPAGSYRPGEIVLREEEGAAAVVDVLGPEGRRDAVKVVRVDGRWRVELVGKRR